MSLCYLCLGAPSEVKVPGYGFSVCKICWRNRENGWDPKFEPSLFNALARAGLLIPDRNENGRLPRAYQPPADFNL